MSCLVSILLIGSLMMVPTADLLRHRRPPDSALAGSLFFIGLEYPGYFYDDE
jgi:hypothetical protein